MIDRSRKIVLIAYYELIRLLRNKETFWLLLFLPILLILILGNALSSAFQIEDQEISQVEVGLVSVDTSNAPYVQILQSDRLSDYLVIQELDSRETLQQMLVDKEIAYGIVIPASFHHQFQSGDAVSWELLPGGDATANMTVISIVEPILDQLNLVQSAAIVLQDPLAASSFAGSAMESERAYVSVVNPDRSDRAYSAIQYYAAAMLVMFMLYTGMSTALSLVEEKEQHTLERVYAAPIHATSILTGKMLGGGLVALLQAAIIIGFTRIVYDVAWGNHWITLLLICVFLIIASISLAVIITAISSSMKTVQGIFTALIVIMTFLSGGFTPDVGHFLESVGKFTLSHWASQSMLHVMMDSASTVIRSNVSMLGFIAIGLFLISALLGRKAVSHE